MNGLLEQQKPPKDKGIVVRDCLIIDLRDCQVSQALFALVDERYQQGLKKYGQPLMADDGRDTVSDAMQEIVDALFYVEKGIIQGYDWYDLLGELCLCAEMLLSRLDKFQGVDTIISTGLIDVNTGTACPAIDSEI